MLAIMGVKPSSEDELDVIMARATGGGANEISFSQFKALHQNLIMA